MAAYARSQGAPAPELMVPLSGRIIVGGLSVAAHFMRNMAIVGGVLVLFYVFNQLQGDAGLSLTDPLFDRG